MDKDKKNNSKYPTNFKETARNFLENGIRSLPIVKGEKYPPFKFQLGESEITWKGFTIDNYTLDIFDNPHGAIGVITGERSLGLEVLDVDLKNASDPDNLWKELSKAINCYLPDFYDKSTISRTRKNGYHFYYRTEIVEGKKVLAHDPNGNGKGTSIIEVMAEGQQVLTYPSPGYEIIQGDLTKQLYVLDALDRDTLFMICRSFDESENEELKEPEPKTYTSNSEWIINPWDDYNKQGLPWVIDELIEAAGFSRAYESGDRTFYKRKGSDNRQGANFHAGKNIFYSFTGNSSLEAGKGYSPAGLLMAIKFNGDGKECFKWLISEGYGEKVPEPIKTVDTDPKTSNPFPVDVFPIEVQDIIMEINETLMFPVDFIGSSILAVASIATGNTYKVVPKNEWVESPILYMALIGSPGTKKTHPLSLMLKPLNKWDNEDHNRYKSEYDQYEVDLEMTKKGEEKPDKPQKRQRIITDITPEAVMSVHENNPHGLLLHSDELSGWFGNFNRYNKGSEESMWLTWWNGNPYQINRKNSPDIRIQNPFVPVVGTIQPGPLREIGKKVGDNGMIDRILPVILDDYDNPQWSEVEMTPGVMDAWEVIVENMFSANTSGASIKIRFSEEAKGIFIPWYNHTMEACKEEPDNIAGIYTKMVSYAIRLSLLLEMLFYACRDEPRPPKEISRKSMEGAIKLVGYFTNTAIRVQDLFFGESDTRFKSETQRKVYNSLPNEFTTGEGKKIAESFGVKERTFQNWLQDQSLYRKLDHGKYRKE